ncbi:hypothetical protein EI171_21070 [Bradyrhizobium sp. LCT2]|uniref:hypothetical protein n=1 Tax=Bradyrhizobium sp. LCT2 TaxID=2493093 RepID=UPI001373ACDD|nr:hypothetical protein [Bradyrhizobium sp. LCT2]QHP69559.1 hypothetical protein EI171_21070 [Bradyrhizobium sp. LCT2]
MAKIIEAVARITAEDKTGAVFDKIAKKIEGIAKSARSSKEVDALSKALARAQQQMAAIDRFGSAKDGFAAARTRFREAQIAVDGAAKAMKNGEGDARSLQRAYESAQGAVSRAAAAFERQKVAVLQAKHGLEQLGIPANRAAAAQNALRAAVDRTNAALERQPGLTRRAIGAVGRGASNALMFAGPGILAGTKGAVKSGAEIQSEMVKMRAAGIPEADINRAATEAPHLTAKYTNVKTADALERFKELRSIVLHPEEAHELLPTAIAANSVLNAMDRSGEAGHGLGFAFRGAEILGRAQNPEKFRDYMDAVIRARQVMGNTVTAEGIYENAKYMRSSGAQLSDRYLTTTALSLAQEMGGSSAGVATDMFEKTVQGGLANRHAAAKAFVRYGLANEQDFEKTKTGELKGLKAGKHVKDWKKAMANPDQWVWENLIPELEKRGVTDQAEQIAEARKMFPGTSSDLVAKLITQKQSLQNHATLYGQAQGLKAAEGNQKDPFVALNSLTTSLTNFTGALTSPAMEDAAGVMASMSGWIGSWAESLSQFSKDHPDAAKLIGGGAVAGAGAVGIAGTFSLVSGLMNGFGLGTSAVALDGSAAALSAAAAELSAAAGVGAAAKGAASTATAAGAGSAIWTAGAAAAPWAAGAAGIAGGLWAMHKSVEDAGYSGLTSGERLRLQRGGSMRDVYRRAFGYGDNTLAPELSDTMTYGTGVSGDKGSQHVDVSGQVTGDGKLQVDINASSSFLDVVRRAEAVIKLSGTINSSGPGSLGHSSPDAAAPAPRPSTGTGGGGAM